MITEIITRNYASAILFGAVFIVLPVTSILKEVRGIEKLSQNNVVHILSCVLSILHILCFFIAYIGVGVWDDFQSHIIFKVCCTILFVFCPIWIISLCLHIGFFKEKVSFTASKKVNINHTPRYSEPMDVVKKSFVSIKAESCLESNKNLHQLFVVDTKDGEYVDYVALDKTNGNAYYAHCVKGDGEEELYSYEISYDEVKRLASKCGSGEKYDSLNSDNWNSFITETVTEDKEVQSFLQIKDFTFKKAINPLKEFYYEYKNTDGHRVVYLRKTTAGYRIFTASVCQDFTTLSFDNCRGEYLIRDMFLEKKDFFNYKAYDRLLSEKEAAFIQKQVRVLKGAALSPNKDFITCCQR